LQEFLADSLPRIRDCCEFAHKNIDG
jgi:hypothetical protein